MPIAGYSLELDGLASGFVVVVVGGDVSVGAGVASVGGVAVGALPSVGALVESDSPVIGADGPAEAGFSVPRSGSAGNAGISVLLLSAAPPNPSLVIGIEVPLAFELSLPRVVFSAGADVIFGTWVPSLSIVNAQVSPQTVATTTVISVNVSPALLPKAL